MPRKNRTFYAYQIDLHYLDTSGSTNVDAVKWDGSIMGDIFQSISTLAGNQKTLYHADSWLMYLNHLSEDQHYIFGEFHSADYGTVGELLHADTLVLRPNPKQIREGEISSTYFIVRKADGLLLLQSNLKLKRSRFEEYIERFAANVILNNNLTFIQICTLVQRDFFKSIRELTTVNKILMEVSRVETIADENAAVRALQNDIEEIKATNVKLEFEAKYQKSGLRGVAPFLRNYKDQKGVTKIVVKGKIGEIEKTINLEESQERYKKKVEVDLNNQPMLSSAEDVLREVASQRRHLRE